MRYYEIVLMIHPDFNEKISSIINDYVKIIVNSSGKVFRTENWGRRQLAYPVKSLHKAYYILLNIGVSQDTIDILNNAFRFNGAIIRSMILRTKNAVTEISPMMKQKEEHQEYLVS